MKYEWWFIFNLFSTLNSFFHRLSLTLTANTFLVNQKLQTKREKLEADMQLVESKLGKISSICNDIVWLRKVEASVKGSKQKHDGMLLKGLLQEKLQAFTYS